MKDRHPELFALLPLIALSGYWLYACPVCAFLTGDARMLRLGFVNIPLIAALAAAAYFILTPGARKE